MVWILKYASEGSLDKLKVVPKTYSTKEEALASIPTREYIRHIENLYGIANHYVGQIVWIVEPISAIESAQLVKQMEEVKDELPYFAK